MRRQFERRLQQQQNALGRHDRAEKAARARRRLAKLRTSLPHDKTIFAKRRLECRRAPRLYDGQIVDHQLAERFSALSLLNVFHVIGDSRDVVECGRAHRFARLFDRHLAYKWLLQTNSSLRVTIFARRRFASCIWLNFTGRKKCLQTGACIKDTSKCSVANPIIRWKNVCSCEGESSSFVSEGVR